MCGIAGFAGLDQRAPLDARLIAPMLQALAHRGPDGEGVFATPRAVLGHRRLAVVDLAAGGQPMQGLHSGTVVVLNGEIYNHVDLARELAAKGHRLRTRSDSEVLAQAYDAWGLGFVERLDGMFAFALWDERLGRLILVRDRMGEKPLYWASAGGALIFSSELTSLLAHPFVESRIDPPALASYLLFEYVPAPQCIIGGVEKLRPGSLLVLERGEMRMHRYWSLRSRPSHAAPASLPVRLRAALERSVRTRLASDVPVGLFVSGGLDSSTIAALAAREGCRDAFCVGFEDAEFDERRYARTLARHAGLNLRERVVTGKDALEVASRLPQILDEPIGDAAVIATTLLCAMAREHVTVALCGEGGDELFGGYPMHRGQRVASWTRRLPAAFGRLAQALAGLFPVRHGDFDISFKLKAFLRGAWAPAPLNQILWMSSFSPEEQVQLLEPEICVAADGARGSLALASEAWAGVGPSGIVARAARFDAVTYLPGNVLAKVDRTGMGVGLELRSPLLAMELVEFAAGLADRELMRGLQGKRILREAARDLLPRELLLRPKKGFGSPMARWLNGPLRELADDLLSPAALRRDGLFVPQTVARLLDEHRALRADHRKPLWTLLAFRLWQEGLRQRSRPAPPHP